MPSDQGVSDIFLATVHERSGWLPPAGLLFHFVSFTAGHGLRDVGVAAAKARAYA